MQGLWEPMFGVSPSPLCFGGGFIHCPVPWDRAGSAREDGLLQFWVLLAQEGTEQGTQDMEERPAAGSTLEMGFSVCVVLCQHEALAVSKHADISSRAS